MKRLMLATVAGAALLAGATAANAQYYYDDGYYAPRGPFVERGVGLQIGPVGVGVYDNSPATTMATRTVTAASRAITRSTSQTRSARVTGIRSRPRAAVTKV